MTSSISEDKNLSFKKDIGEDVDLNITSDRIKLKQVLLNLMSNAFKYSEKGTVTLRIFRRENYFKIDIVDQGIGIEQSHIEDIFKEFHQVDGSYTRKVGGTGLGLAITKRFVEILRGKVEAVSEIGVGSIFTIYLPVDYNSTDESLLSDQLNLENIKGSGEEKVIAFIENDFSIRRLYCEYLKNEGYLPVLIDDKDEFEVMLEKIIELKPQAIILDLILYVTPALEIFTGQTKRPAKSVVRF